MHPWWPVLYVILIRVQRSNVYQCPPAAVTKLCTLSSLKPAHTDYLTVLEVRCQSGPTGLYSFWRLQGKVCLLVLCSFPRLPRSFDLGSLSSSCKTSSLAPTLLLLPVSLLLLSCQLLILNLQRLIVSYRIKFKDPGRQIQTLPCVKLTNIFLT